jgi:hypothetical protein
MYYPIVNQYDITDRLLLYYHLKNMFYRLLFVLVKQKIYFL